MQFINHPRCTQEKKEPYQRQVLLEGSIIHTAEGLEGILSQYKCYKMKSILRELLDMLNRNTRKLPRKGLLSNCRLLVYCTSMYGVLNPNLKGLNLTVG